MRFAVLLAACLVLLNVVVFLWPSGAAYAPNVHAARKDVNPHFIRLNKEIEERFFSQVAAEAGVVPAGQEVQLAAISKPGEACYRLGPFMHRENYELAQAVLLNANLEYRKSKRASKTSDVFRVFLGPYETREQVADARTDLKRNNVLDHFVRKQDDGSYIISLGIYSTQEAADTAVELFDGKLSGVQKQGEVVMLPESYWLHFSMTDQQASRLQLSAMDWGEQSAKMGLYPCNG